MQASEAIEMRVRPIGVIRTPFPEPAGTPIQPPMSEGAEGRVIVFDEYREALSDLEGFDRIWLVYWFHCAAPARMRVTPFLDSRERGLFATRAPCRPNPIGISCVRLLAIEGNVLRVSEVDIVDGTPSAGHQALRAAVRRLPERSRRLAGRCRTRPSPGRRAVHAGLRARLAACRTCAAGLSFPTGTTERVRREHTPPTA
jgi:tRNA (adenine37-N6)-methyltransferase